MSNASKPPAAPGFVKTFVLPALLIFAIPVASYLFFWHAQSRFDAEARAGVLQQIRDDESLGPAEREEATAFFTEHPFSELVTNPEFAANVDAEALRDYAMFRWFLRLSLWSVIVGVAVLALAGLCVALSLRSQRAQYLSLTAGWQVLRIYGALQTIVQGVLLVALSFWVTALWFGVYVPKLIFVAGALALFAVGAVIKAIFTTPKQEHVVNGKVIDRQTAAPLWQELQAICSKVGTNPPDQIIAGIDDNFYVTEMPVTVDGKTYHGRTLYVSLSLLKQLQGAEADAILAHEMAHFSGNDTLYSKKISPLLARYSTYLQALYEGGVTRPVFHFMNFFRALYELSLSRHSRQREYRADDVAVEATSPRDFATALLRVVAYSKFRNEIQQELFGHERALETANISARLEQGFHGYARKFAADPGIGELESAHPFDSHPPLALRLAAVGAPLDGQNIEAQLAAPAVGRWYQKFDDAEQLERQQWDDFEQKFRAYHEESLAYRLLPETDEERALVVKWFPAWSLAGAKGELQLDCETMHYTEWPDAVPFAEFDKCELNDGVLQIAVNRNGKHVRKLKLKTFGKQQQEALDAINRYLTRYRCAEAYQAQKRQELAETTAPASDALSVPTT